jgi:hypothetical protein
LPGRPGERWGLYGAQQVRSTYAVENPDSLMFFAHALRLSTTGLLWDTGYSDDRYSRYQTLKRDSPNDIWRFRLDQPT